MYIGLGKRLIYILLNQKESSKETYVYAPLNITPFVSPKYVTLNINTSAKS